MALNLHFTDFPSLIAHRGLSAYAPENTLNSFALARKHGLTWMECDVRLSKDKKPMVIHDSDIERTTNGHGLVSELTQKRIQTFDAGSWFSPSYSGAKIPSLFETLELGVRLQFGINIEIKPNLDEEEETVERIAFCLRARKKNPPILLSSFSLQSLGAVQTLLPEYPRAWIVDNTDTYSSTEILDITELHDCTSLHIAQELIMTDLISQISVGPFDLMSFTINSQKDADQCWNAGCVSVFTDNGLKAI